MKKKIHSKKHVTPAVAQADAQSDASQRMADTQNALHPSTELLCKIGSALVHADEAMSPSGHPFDAEEFRQRFNDAEVQAWIKAMGPLLPLKRSEKNHHDH
jgi:hypothetical protein